MSATLEFSTVTEPLAMTGNRYQTILVPTDLSDFGDLALRYALLFARQLGSRLTLLHAEEIAWLATEHPIGYTFTNATEAEAALKLRLSEYAAAYVAPDVSVSTRFQDGAPDTEIVKMARELHSDLVIMGTHARRGIRRAFLGSVAEAVLRESRIPVITVAPTTVPRSGDVRIKTVLCPMNFTEVARMALDEACAVAEAFDAELVVVHVADGNEPRLFSAVQTEFGRWVDPALRAGTRYKEIVSQGNAAERVLAIADQIDADLLVIGARHRRFSDATVVGTTTERIVRFARSAVMTIMQRSSKVGEAAS